MQLVERSCLPKRQLAEVCLVGGDIRDSLGLRSDAHKLWHQALTLAKQECQALGLKERQVQSPFQRCPSFPCILASACHRVYENLCHIIHANL